ncbi:MAG: hypothetical protein ACPF97_09585 [Ilumatobacteraceae bacterium]
MASITHAVNLVLFTHAVKDFEFPKLLRFLQMAYDSDIFYNQYKFESSGLRPEVGDTVLILSSKSVHGKPHIGKTGELIAYDKSPTPPLLCFVEFSDGDSCRYRSYEVKVAASAAASEFDMNKLSSFDKYRTTCLKHARPMLRAAEAETRELIRIAWQATLDHYEGGYGWSYMLQHMDHEDSCDRLELLRCIPSSSRIVDYDLVQILVQLDDLEDVPLPMVCKVWHAACADMQAEG